MATRDEIRDAAGDAQLALVTAIKTMADLANAGDGGEWAARSAVAYAEAYAWLYSPAQPHGGAKIETKA